MAGDFRHFLTGMSEMRSEFGRRQLFAYSLNSLGSSRSAAVAAGYGPMDPAAQLDLDRWKVDRGTPDAAIALPASQRFALKTRRPRRKEAARIVSMISATSQALDAAASTGLSFPTPSPRDRQRFNELVEEWRRETVATPTLDKQVLHPAYQKIIGMGERAVPLLIEELREEPDHWFWALTAITGEDPIPPEARGRLDLMAEAWLHWAEKRHLI